MHSDDLWDEYRWEQFLRESDRRIDRFMDHLYRFIAHNPPPSRTDPEAVAAWEAELRAFLTSRGLPFDEAAFPFFFDEASEGEEGEAEGSEWLSEGAEGLLDDEADELSDVRQLPVYQASYALSVDVLAWSEQIRGRDKDSTLVQCCAYVTQIAANIAKGHSFGYEQDFIGGNIACAKRALAAANEALVLFQEMKTTSYMKPGVYRTLYEQVYEVRNQLGLYVQELRRRFELGID